MSNPRFLSVQSIYVLPGAPAPHLEAMRNWNPSEHHEPKVFLHGDISGAISESTLPESKVRQTTVPCAVGECDRENGKRFAAQSRGSSEVERRQRCAFRCGR